MDDRRQRELGEEVGAESSESRLRVSWCVFNLFLSIRTDMGPKMTLTLHGDGIRKISTCSSLTWRLTIDKKSRRSVWLLARFRNPGAQRRQADHLLCFPWTSRGARFVYFQFDLSGELTARVQSWSQQPSSGWLWITSIEMPTRYSTRITSLLKMPLTESSVK